MRLTRRKEQILENGNKGKNHRGNETGKLRFSLQGHTLTMWGWGPDWFVRLHTLVGPALPVGPGWTSLFTRSVHPRGGPPWRFKPIQPRLGEKGKGERSREIRVWGPPHLFSYCCWAHPHLRESSRDWTLPGALGARPRSAEVKACAWARVLL